MRTATAVLIAIIAVYGSRVEAQALRPARRAPEPMQMFLLPVLGQFDDPFGDWYAYFTLLNTSTSDLLLLAPTHCGITNCSPNTAMPIGPLRSFVSGDLIGYDERGAFVYVDPGHACSFSASLRIDEASRSPEGQVDRYIMGAEVPVVSREEFESTIRLRQVPVRPGVTTLLHIYSSEDTAVAVHITISLLYWIEDGERVVRTFPGTLEPVRYYAAGYPLQPGFLMMSIDEALVGEPEGHVFGGLNVTIESLSGKPIWAMARSIETATKTVAITSPQPRRIRAD